MDDIDAYLAAQPERHREMLSRVRAVIREACPEATEGLYYRMPGFRLRGKLLFSYAGFKKHCAIYPASGMIQATLGAELKPYLTEKATIQFTVDHPISDDLVRRITEVRVAEGTGPKGGR